jgi:S-adenosylmethionine:tRNA ribosyltransferase-isomerase
MKYIPRIELEKYYYNLPNEKIAQFPLEERDQSKLLVYSSKEDTIEHTTFSEIANYLPENSVLIRNTTKVVPARIYLQKETGGVVEVFIVNPHLFMNEQSGCTVDCLLRGKNLQIDTVLSGTFSEGTHQIELQATIVKKSDSVQTILLNWTPEQKTLSEIIWAIGSMPLPPYMKRETIEEDTERYQTVYAKEEGSIAAPTAGLHVTEAVLHSIAQKNIPILDVMLHVGLGTFKPVEAKTIDEHSMHSESLVISKLCIENLLKFLHSDKQIVCLGTTSVRTIESLYWFGVRLILNDDDCSNTTTFSVQQWDPYRLSQKQESLPTAIESLSEILNWMNKYSLESVSGVTTLIIIPGYDWKIVNGIITNYHQPGSTLLLLIASFLGKNWEKVYKSALNESYRFLSYGDSSLLLR